MHQANAELGLRSLHDRKAITNRAAFGSPSLVPLRPFKEKAKLLEFVDAFIQFFEFWGLPSVEQGSQHELVR